MKKRLFTVFLILLLLLMVSASGLTANAAGTPTYQVNAVVEGENLAVTVVLPGSAKAAGGSFTLQYNNDNLEYSNVEGNPLGAFNPAYQANAVRSSFAAATAYHSDTVVVKVIFTIKNGKVSANDISLPRYELNNENSERISNQNDGAAIYHFVCPHTDPVWQTVKEPTHTEAGGKALVCKTCNAIIETGTVPATGHSFGDWTILKNPTCTEAGEEVRVCSCGEKETRPLGKTSHVFGEWVVTRDYTCTEDGVKERACATCGEKETAALPAAHRMQDPVVVKEPTCTEDGLEEGVCPACGEKASNVLPAPGHSFGEWVVWKEATENEEGLKERTCRVCGERETESIEKLAPATTEPSGTSEKEPQNPQTGVATVAGVLAIGVTAFSCLVFTKKKKPF